MRLRECVNPDDLFSINRAELTQSPPPPPPPSTSVEHSVHIN